jgi:hypothetical protein
MLIQRRYRVKEVSLKRLLSAVKARLYDIPHSMAWDFSLAAKKNKKNIEKYKNTHMGQRCFIVANGPSLLSTDLALLDNEIAFGMNRIYVNFEGSTFRPTYYIAMNELVLEQFAHEISRLFMPKFLNWNRRTYYENNDKETYFLKSKMVIRDYFQYDLTKPFVVGASVTFAALQLAYYMGFQQAILIGLDHHYAEKGIPNQTEIRTAERDESHFHSQYFPKGIKWQFPDLRRSEIDFEIAKKAFEKDNREILDATINGKCKIFKKVDYLSLFE